jgi:hypothetical protein
LTAFNGTSPDTQERKVVKDSLSRSLGNEIAKTITSDKSREFYNDYMTHTPLALDHPDYTPQQLMAAYLLHTWAMSSHDSVPMSIAIQETIKKKFNLDAYDRGHPGNSYRTSRDIKERTDQILEKYGDILRAYVDATYKETQFRLKEAGVKALTVYRGMVEDPEGGIDASMKRVIENREVHLQPASSFATEYSEAAGFASGSSATLSHVMAITVPVERIFSTAVTGLGCLEESEVVVLGGKYQARVATWTRYNEFGKGKPDVGRFWNTLKEEDEKSKSDKPILTPDYNDENADWPKRTPDTIDVFPPTKQDDKDGQKNCGTGAGGFQPGNTCARGGDGGSDTDSTPSPAVIAWAGEKFGNRRASNGELVADNFVKWFGKSQVLDKDGNPQETQPIEVYHGTTHDFNEFTMERGNPENDMGRGHYFTEERYDAANNYAGRGPDLKLRIDRKRDEIYGDVESILESYESDEERLDAFENDLGAPKDVVAEVLARTDEPGDIADVIAEHLMMGDNPHTIAAYLKIEKPVVLGDPKWGKGIRRAEEGETVFDLNYDEEDADGRKPDDPDFDPDTSEFTGVTGMAAEFLDAVNSRASDYDADVSEAIEELKLTIADNGGMAAGELISRVKSFDNFMDVQDDDGNLISADIIAQALRDVGFTGVIYRDASKHFNMDIPPNTRHFIVWDSENIKSVDNIGTFDPKNPDITKAAKQTDCGANAPGGGGFQPGNTCGRNSGGAGPKTNTPEFKSWFKQSKVVNSDGSPKVVYHGTRADDDFTAFRTPTEREFPTLDQMLGNHFADSDDLAESFTMMSAGAEQGRVIPAYLSIQNPRIAPQRMLDNGTLEHDAYAINRDIINTVFPKDEQLFVDWITRARMVTEEWGREIFQRLSRGESIGEDDYNGVAGHDLSIGRWEGQHPVASYLGNYDSGLNHLKFAEKTRVIEAYKAEMRKQGFDGIQYTNTAPMEIIDTPEDKRTCWIAFEPTQIKSATGNSGKFDPKDPDIRKSTKADDGCGRNSDGTFASGNSCAGDGQGGGYADRVANQMAKLKTDLEGINSRYSEAQSQYEQIYNELGGSYDTAKDNPKFIESRDRYNAESRTRASAYEKINKYQKELDILKTGGKTSHAIEVRVADGVDVHPEIAQAMVSGLVKRPWGDESEWVSNRYTFVLEKHRDGYGDDTYGFRITNKHAPEPIPAGQAVLDAIPNREGFVYRGMSAEEWNASIKSGVLQSLGSHNMDQDGLTFYGSADTAEYYSTGFAPFAYQTAPGRDGVVIEIPRNLVMDHTNDSRIPQSEFAHAGSIPLSSVTSRYVMRATGFEDGMVESVYNGGKIYEGSRMSPSVPRAILSVATDDLIKPVKFSYRQVKSTKVFCPTGPGGGIDPTCSPGGSGGGSSIDDVTKTSEFKNWFGDWENNPANASKVVTEAGDPGREYGVVVKVYHGSGDQDGFTKFDPEKVGRNGTHAGAGFYFSENRDIAKNYAESQSGSIYEVFLNIRNPFDFDRLISKTEMLQWADIVDHTPVGRDMFSVPLRRTIDFAYEHESVIPGNRAWEILAANTNEFAVNRVLKDYGYDGIVHRAGDIYGTAVRPGQKDLGRVWVAFEPTQIKSTANRKFDPTNPDILKSTKATTATEWLLGEVDDDPDFLNDLFAGSPFGKLNIGIVTEIPFWMQTAIRSFLQETYSQPYWKNISATTLHDIERALERGLTQGQSIRDMSQQIRRGLITDGEDPDYAKWRSRNIAITESGNALNGGRTLAFDHLQEVLDDKPEVKNLIKRVWQSILMETTRDAHADLDGVPEDESGLWDLNGVLCRWPSDVTLPASDRCNCYCTVVTEFGMDDAERADLLEQYTIRVMEREEKLRKAFQWGLVRATKQDGNALWRRVPLSKSNQKNCGTGAGGFQPGNDCARGDGGGIRLTGKISDGTKSTVMGFIEKAKEKGVVADIAVSISSKANWAGRFVVDKDKIELSEHYVKQFSNPEMKSAEVRGYSSVSRYDHPESLLVHELAHVQHFNSLKEQFGKDAAYQHFLTWCGGVKRLESVPVLNSDEYTGLAFKKIAGTVSQYAATNPLEFVAEVYTGRKYGKDYSDNVNAMYAAFGGPK